MTDEQRRAAKAARTHKRETVTTLSGAIVCLMAWTSEVEMPPEPAAALVTIMTILGHKWVDKE